jgi:hypothetical protein
MALSTFFALMGTGSLALAQQVEDAPPAEGDVAPPSPPMPPTPGTTVYRQAGTGSEVPYASAGILELGGAGALDVGENITILSLRPFAGWFITDNLQLSGILELRWADVAGNSNTIFGLLGEPSYHLPFNPRLFGFLGVGAGIANNGDETGFALRPRIGVDMLVGRSGIFRPTLELTWSTVDVVTQEGSTLVGISTRYGATFSYSVMW